MTVDELQQFIENKLYADVSTDKYNELMTAAESMDLRSFANEYGDFMSNNSEGWVDFSKKFPKSLSERIRNEFGSSDNKNPFSSKSQKEIDEIYNTYFSDDVPREQFDKNLTAMAKFWDAETNERDYEAGKYKRKQEINNDWGHIRNVLASDYEKQRYINEPEKAIFGKEAPDPWDAPETRWGAIGDAGAGAAALVGDVTTSFLKMNPVTFVPAIATGPVIRGFRDVVHKMTNSPYQKESTDIISDVARDITSNAGIEGLANLRQFSRILNSISDGPIGIALKNEESISNLKKQIDAFPYISELKDVSNSELFEMIHKLPSDSPFKQALQPYAKDIYNIDRAGIAGEIDRARKQVDLFENPELNEAIKSLVDRDYTVKPRIGERVFEQELMSTPSLTRAQLLGKNALKMGKKIPQVAGAGLKATNDATRKESIQEPERLERDWLIENYKPSWDWYLENYKRDWDLGFVPKMKEGDPKWEAYRVYYYNKTGKYPEDEKWN